MQSFADLERHVDRVLADLPPLGAPDTLLPRVLAAVQAWADRPWYQRAWLTWPAGLQAASVTLLILLLLGGAMAMPLVQAEAARAAALIATRLPIDWPNIGSSFGVRASALVLVWRALIQPLLPFALAIAFMAGVASAVVVTALNRVLLERSVQR
jgi:hypothetical protein